MRHNGLGDRTFLMGFFMHYVVLLTSLINKINISIPSQSDFFLVLGNISCHFLLSEVQSNLLNASNMHLKWVRCIHNTSSTSYLSISGWFDVGVTFLTDYIIDVLQAIGRYAGKGPGTVWGKVAVRAPCASKISRSLDDHSCRPESLRRERENGVRLM